MKRQLLILLLCTLPIILCANVYKSITQNEVDKLRTLLTNQEKATITHLTLKGYIDARDFKTMRDEMPSLEDIDLSAAVILAYKGKSGTFSHKGPDWIVGDNDGYCEYSANAIPTEAFTQLFNNTLSKWLSGRKSLRKITLPVNIENIEDKAFYDCKNLAYCSIPLSTANKLISDDGVVYSKDKSTLIQFPPAKIGEYQFPATLKTIQGGALSGCYFSLLTFQTAEAPIIPSTDFSAVLIKVPQNCIANYTDLSSFKIIDKLNSVAVHVDKAGDLAQVITAKAIHPSLIHSISISGTINETDFNTLNNMSSLYSIDMSSADITEKGIPEDAFKENTNLCTIKFPNNIEFIGFCAFWYCTNLMGEIVLPPSLSAIGGSAFQKTLVSKINFPSALSYIGGWAFRETKLSSADLSACTELTDIQDKLFYDCANLSEVILPPSLESIDEEAFYNMPAKAINFPNTLRSIGKYAFYSSNLEKVVFPASLEEIQESSFSYNTKLYEANFSSCTRLTTIGYSGFYANSSLKTVDLRKCTALKSIGTYAFASSIPHLVTSPPSYPVLAGLERIYLPVSIEEIGNNIFYECNELKEVEISYAHKLQQIPESAFEGCDNLESIIIPRNVSFIARNAFYSCQKLREIRSLAKTVPTATTEAFADIDKSLVNLYVPKNTLSNYMFAPAWKDFINIHEFGPINYSVSFDTKGGSSIGSVIAEWSYPILQPINPIRQDYNFAGWFLDPEYTKEWKFDTDIVLDNLTLYAKWNLTTGVSSDYVPPTVHIYGTKQGINIENQTNKSNYAIYTLTGKKISSGMIKSEESICIPMPVGVYIIKTEDVCAKVVIQ